DGDGWLGGERLFIEPHQSAAERTGARRRLYGVFRLRSHADHVPGEIQQSGQFPRLSLRAAATNGDLNRTTDDGGRMMGNDNPSSVVRPPSSEAAQRAAVVAAARSWIGTPYH